MNAASGAVVGKLDDHMAVDVLSKMPPRTSDKIGHLATRPCRAHQQAREAAKLAAGQALKACVALGMC